MLDNQEGNSGAKQRKQAGLARPILDGFVLMLASSGVQAILRVVILAILARLLSQEDFGLANAALTVISFAAIMSQLGLDKALIQRIELTEAHVRTAFTVFTLSGIVVGALVALLAPQIAAFFRADELIPVVRVVSLTFPLQGITLVPAALLKRKLKFRRFAGIDALSYLTGFGIVGISMALAGFGVWALIAASLTQALFVIVWLIIMQPFSKRPMFDRQAFKDLVYFGGGHTVARTLNQVGGEADNLIVGRWLGVSALGIYGRAYQMLVFPVNIFSSTISNILFPAIAKFQDDIPRLARAFRRATAVIALVYLPLSIVLIVLAPELVAVLLGPTWQEVILPFQILAVGLLFRANKVNLVVAQATGAVYKRAWREGMYGLFVVIGSMVGLRWGLPGVAFGVLVALLANFLLMSDLTLRLTHVSWQEYLATHLPALRLSGVTLVVLWSMASLLRHWALPNLVTLFGACAVTATLLLVLIYRLPNQFLGEEGNWLLDTVLDYLPKRVSTPLAGLRVGRQDNAT